MSESDYNRIFGGEAELAEDEVFRVWREEGSRESMLDNSGTKRLESVTLGRCTNAEWEEPEGAESIGYDFRIQGEKIEELLGFSLTGIVVLPDGVMKDAADRGKFHQVLMILNMDEENLAGATAFAEEQRSDGVLEEAFCRRTIEGIDRKESVLNRLISGIVVGAVVMLGMFVAWLVHFSEIDEKRARHKFLCVLGMDRRQARRVADVEILRSVLVPVLLAAGVSWGFCRTFLAAYYDGSDIAGADKRLLLAIIFAYVAGEAVFCVLNQVWCKRQLEKE